MIRTNLSTRPFYNERIVHVWLIAIALVVVLAATAFNVSRVLRYSRSDTRLATQASQRRSARRRSAPAGGAAARAASIRGRSTAPPPTRGRPTI